MKILSIDPGSTSTKIGVFIHGACLSHRRQALHPLSAKGGQAISPFSEDPMAKGEMIRVGVDHDRQLIGLFRGIHEQEDMRFACIMGELEKQGLGKARFDAVVGRGGLIRPVSGGVYKVCDALLSDLKIGVSGSHASNLGGILARRFAASSGCEAFIVDPVVVDELDEVARLSGLAGIERQSIFHALNQKAVARKVSGVLGIPYQDARLIVVHMGGGITVGAHKRGRVVDVNNGLNGDGPYAAERSGSLPVAGILRVLKEGRYTPESLLRVVSGEGGIFSYLGIVDLREVERRMDDGDAEASLAWTGMVYQIAKEVGSLAAALDGKVDAIVLTGGMAHSARIVKAIMKKTAFIAKGVAVPGEFELEALTDGALRVLTGREKAKRYGE
ncbi:butyrate kinase [Desulfoluna sp.]|uniref:butyrate kinase n=1 Tax=Desulfoluna sp. TaxID=2045199 RepID=UPI002608944C|nr:butyrate kinase [Desulfoluna sp.]